MDRLFRTVLPLLVCFALAPPAPAQQGALEIEIEVDCDQGDSLDRALRRAERALVATLHVRGTCLASLTVRSENVVEIIGDPDGGTVLQSGPSPVVHAVGPGRLQLRDLRLVGGMGVRSTGNQRFVGLTGCEIESQSLGVFAESGSGVFVLDSDIQALDTAVQVADAQVVVQQTRLHDSTFAARAFGGDLWLDRVEAEDNVIGVLVEDRSSLVVLGGRFSENGQGHLGGTDGSRLELYNVQIGGSGDGTALSLSGNGSVSIQAYYDDPAIDVWGPANLHDDSFLSFTGGTLHGSIQARGFSRVLLEGAVENGIGCGRAADAWCGFGASATTNGCPSAPQACTPSKDAPNRSASPWIRPTPPRLFPDAPASVPVRGTVKLR